MVRGVWEFKTKGGKAVLAPVEQDEKLYGRMAVVPRNDEQSVKRVRHVFGDPGITLRVTPGTLDEEIQRTFCRLCSCAHKASAYKEQLLRDAKGVKAFALFLRKRRIPCELIARLLRMVKAARSFQYGDAGSTRVGTRKNVPIISVKTDFAFAAVRCDDASN